jgi:hypothetical protein
MNTPPSPPPRRRRRWILLATLLIIVILGVLIAGRGDLPGFNTRVAALRAAGQPVSHTDLPGSTPPPPGLAREILLLDNYAAQLEALDRIGDPNVLQQLQRREARIKSEPRWVREVYFGHPIAVHEGCILIKAHARLGLLAVAAHRYRLDHNGAFPTAPSDLVPRYLPTLPTDPFTGGPPTFQRLDPGLAIGFDRSAHTGMNSPAPTEPGGPNALLHLTR